MTPEQYTKLCQNLARKYNAPWHYQDLVSEGLVAIYAELEKDPKSKRTVVVAKEAMWEYFNLKTRTVSLPDVNEVRYITSLDQSWIRDHSNWSETALNWLSLVLKGSQGTLAHDEVSTEGPEEALIRKDAVTKIYSVAEDVLEGRSLEIFMLYFKEGVDQPDLAYTYEISQQGVGKNLQKSCVKVRKALLNMRLKV